MSWKTLHEIVETLFCLVENHVGQWESAPTAIPKTHHELWKADWMNVNYATIHLSGRAHTHVNMDETINTNTQLVNIHMSEILQLFSNIMCRIECGRTIYMTDQGQFNIQADSYEVEIRRMDDQLGSLHDLVCACGMKIISTFQAKCLCFTIYNSQFGFPSKMEFQCTDFSFSLCLFPRALSLLLFIVK